MMDKKAFGSFIRSKRTEKNYSQKDLAGMLFVTEWAVSKWERGVSYPDISLIPDICRALDVSEHELLTASTDTDTRKMRHEAQKFRVIRSAWFWVPTISYAVALLTCFICNLAVNHTLSWFFVVFTALVCAYTFVPTVTHFFNSSKLLSFAVSTYLSICLLLFTCGVYTRDMSWFLTACIGVLMGYVQVFAPIFLSNGRYSRYKFVISFAATCILTLVLLICIRMNYSFRLFPAIMITLYAYMPAILCTVICAFHFDVFLKTGICIAFSTVVYHFAGYIVNVLFGLNENHYQVNFYDWAQCLQGNVHFIVLTSFLFISALFALTGIYRICKTKKR